MAKGAVDLDGIDGDSDADDADDEKAKDFEGLLTWLGEALSDDITEARLSKRLTESAACLVGDDFSMSPQLEKLYRASGQEVPKTKRALELNAAHPLVAGLNKAFGATTDHQSLIDTARLVYGMALIAEGGELDDPAAFARLLAATLTDSLGAQEQDGAAAAGDTAGESPKGDAEGADAEGADAEGATQSGE